MPSPNDIKQLSAADPDEWLAVASTVLPAPAVDARQEGFVGASRLALPMLVALLPANSADARQTGHLHRAAAGDVRTAGWEVFRAADNPQLLHISRKRAAPCRVAAPMPDAPVQACGDAIVADVAGLPAALDVEAADDNNGLFRLRVVPQLDGSVALQCFHKSVTVAFSLPTLSAPLAQWSLGDAWLAAETNRLAATGDPVDLLAAAGHTLRLASDDRIPSSAELTAQLSTIPPQVAWASGLSVKDVATTVTLLCVRAERLREKLARLLDSEDLPAAAFAKALTVCLRQRDDLESARAMLAPTAVRGRADLALRDLDDLARPVCAHFDASCVVPDEQLARAASVQADAWWAKVGDSDDDLD